MKKCCSPRTTKSRGWLLGLLLGIGLAALVAKWVRERLMEDQVLYRPQRPGTLTETVASIGDFPPSFVQATGAVVGEIPLPVEEPPAPAAAESAPPETVQPDDLKLIDGIGPVYEQILFAAGIKTFKDLAGQPVEALRPLFAGRRLADPTTWPEQAALAAAGKWEEFEKLKEELRGGKR